MVPVRPLNSMLMHKIQAPAEITWGCRSPHLRAGPQSTLLNCMKLLVLIRASFGTKRISKKFYSDNMVQIIPPRIVNSMQKLK